VVALAGGAAAGLGYGIVGLATAFGFGVVAILSAVA
jgi:hypothetical protein